MAVGIYARRIRLTYQLNYLSQVSPFPLIIHFDHIHESWIIMRSSNSWIRMAAFISETEYEYIKWCDYKIVYYSVFINYFLRGVNHIEYEYMCLGMNLDMYIESQLIMQVFHSSKHAMNQILCSLANYIYIVMFMYRGLEDWSEYESDLSRTVFHL